MKEKVHLAATAATGGATKGGEEAMVISDDDDGGGGGDEGGRAPPPPPPPVPTAAPQPEGKPADAAAPPPPPPPQPLSRSDPEWAREVAAMLAAADAVGDDEWDVLSPPVHAPGAPVTTAIRPTSGGGGPTARTAAPPPPRPQPLVDLDAELAAATAEADTARGDARRARIGADGPTTEMFEQVQELLQLFGIPYLVAPMEAEAQCAWLDSHGLVDGVATDDNDVFLFGGATVYRHLFADAKYVEEYRTADVGAELGLGRRDLIRLAQLLGSDYAEGVAGVGVVNAVEVLRAFPGDAGLADFRAWVDAPDDRLVGLAAKAAGQKQHTAAASNPTSPLSASDPPARAEFKRRHRGARTNWQVPDNFPSDAVCEAYENPRVDAGTAKFVQVPPAVDELRAFCGRVLGWTPARAEQVLAPALKVKKQNDEGEEKERGGIDPWARPGGTERALETPGPPLLTLTHSPPSSPPLFQAYAERKTQATMTQFLTFRTRFAKIRSTRLQRAVAGITGGHNPDILLDDEETLAGEGGGGGRHKGARGGGGAGGSGPSSTAPYPAAAPAKKRAARPPRKAAAAAAAAAAAKGKQPAAAAAAGLDGDIEEGGSGSGGSDFEPSPPPAKKKAKAGAGRGRGRGRGRGGRGGA